MAAEMVSTEQMISAARTVEREWGEYGYRIGVESTCGGGLAIFVVRCSDGGEFHLLADRYGQVALLPEDRDYRNHLDGWGKLLAVVNTFALVGAVA